jgi:hypothetical protein
VNTERTPAGRRHDTFLEDSTVSRRQQTMRMLRLPAVLGCAAVLALSGCGTGPEAFTSLHVSAVNGASGEVGPIVLRDTVFAYPGGDDVFGYRPGEDVPLGVTIVNQSDTPDQLIAVSSPVAGSVRVEGPTIIPGHDAVTTRVDASSLGAEAPRLRIVLTDLREPIRPGLNTPVTFVFRQAGKVTMAVPINAPIEADPAQTGNGHHTGA